MTPARPERRDRVLTDGDIADLFNRLDKAEDDREKKRREEQTQLFESIGYDISSPQTRSEIRDDKLFVRGLRKGAVRAKLTAIGVITLGLLSMVGHWVVSGFMMAIKSPMKLP